MPPMQASPSICYETAPRLAQALPRHAQQRHAHTCSSLRSGVAMPAAATLAALAAATPAWAARKRGLLLPHSKGARLSAMLLLLTAAERSGAALAAAAAAALAPGGTPALAMAQVWLPRCALPWALPSGSTYSRTIESLSWPRMWPEKYAERGSRRSSGGALAAAWVQYCAPWVQSCRRRQGAAAECGRVTMQPGLAPHAAPRQAIWGAVGTGGGTAALHMHRRGCDRIYTSCHRHRCRHMQGCERALHLAALQDECAVSCVTLQAVAADH